MLHTVVLKSHDDLAWPFDSTNPVYNLDNSGHHSVTVDPAPSYAHSPELVSLRVNRTTQAFPISWPVTFYVLSNEFLSRTNAFAQGSAFDYNSKVGGEGEEKYPRAPYIVFSGKRIPIMPAMTRYLVAHEYGHIVEDWIAVQRKQKDFELLREYAELRGIKQPSNYGCGTWHETPGEIFANDFRILICEAETEFWPHHCPRPEDNYAIIGWWEKAKELAQIWQPWQPATNGANLQSITQPATSNR